MDYELKLSQQAVQVIIAALGELPLKVSAQAFNAVQMQVQAQDEKNAIPIGNLQGGSNA